MSAPPDIQFGIDWKDTARRWGVPGISLFDRHTYCAYNDVGNGAYYHRKERIKAMWPDFQWHRWADRMLMDLCKYRWNSWLGPGSSGKSAASAVFAMEWWMQAPHESAVVVCSTTMKLLRMRIWNYIANFHSRLPKNMGNVGTLLDTDTRIRWEQGNNNSGIFGMAVEEGPVDEVVNNLIGIHPKRYLLILDEAQGVREAIMRATTNMSKNQWFGALLMGNPDDMDNPLLRESEPLGGWDSVVTAETEAWDTLGGPTKGNGRCNFFDGRKSPADDSPEERKRLPFLINKDWRDAHLKSVRGNENDPSYWSQAIGWPPPMGIVATVLDSATVMKFKCREKAIWTNGFQKGAGLDPSFEGGDRKVLTVGRFGEVRDEEGKRWVIESREQVDVPINAKSKEPIHYQIVHWVMAYLMGLGIGPADFSLDSSGEGGGLKAIFDQEWGEVTGIEFGGAPSDTPIQGKPGKTAKDEYDRRSSELSFNVQAFARSNGLRGLTPEAELDLVQRKTFFKGKKYCVEPKTTRSGEKGFKQRTGRSPDHGDSLAVFTAHCMQRGAYPEIGTPLVSASAEREMVAAIADEFDENNYTTGYDFN